MNWQTEQSPFAWWKRIHLCAGSTGEYLTKNEKQPSPQNKIKLRRMRRRLASDWFNSFGFRNNMKQIFFKTNHDNGLRETATQFNKYFRSVRGFWRLVIHQILQSPQVLHMRTTLWTYQHLQIFTGFRSKFIRNSFGIFTRACWLQSEAN